MKPILVTLIFCFSITALFAQNNFSIKGAVTDTASNSKLANTTITVINAKDSILQKFTRVAADGTFGINNLGKGKYILMVTYPGFADYTTAFSLDSVKKEHNFGVIKMILKSNLLKEVLIKGEVTAIKIKGDTTEFNAKAYKINPNDKIEDLIKQFPGIQVDQNGKITAQGKTIEKVLVDGEEFFGDDPTLVTRNLRADMVDKVQLYDKKSDQATFTGIDDGIKTPTLNIKLRADKKSGYFGKVDAVQGTDGYYQDQLMFNKFKNKEKFAVYGNAGNTGTVGLGWQDNSKYGSGGLQVTDDGQLYLNNSGGDDELDSFDGKYNKEGIPLARTGGAHYDNKWDNDKKSINANYKIGELNVDGSKNIQTQNNFPDSVFKSNEDQTFHDHMFRQKLDVTYQVKLDTTSNLKVYIDGTDKHSTTRTTDTTATTRQDSLGSSLQTELNRKLNNSVDSKIFNVNAFYTKKFKKKGRTLSAYLGDSFNQSDAIGTLTYTTKYYNTKDVLLNTVMVDQKKINNNKSSSLNSSITYTEPLSKTTSMILTYGLNVDNSTSDRRSYNKPDSTAPGPAPLNDYTILEKAFSNDFRLNVLTNQGGLHFNYKKNKIIFNFGTNISHVAFNQVDKITDSTLNRSFTNWNPQATFQYNYSTHGSFYVNYNGRSQQPSINELQPVRDNTNPLYIPIGNPHLKPSFTNSFYFNYYSYKVISGQFISVNGSYSTTSNPIVDSVTMTGGNSTSKYINLANHQTNNFNFNINYSKKIKPLDLDAGFNGSVSGSTYYGYNNLVNALDQPAQLNKTSNYTYSAQVSLNKNVQKKYEFGIAAGPNYTINSSSLQSAVNNNGRGFNGNWWLNVFLPAHFGIGTWGNYVYNAKTASFDEDYRQTNFNAYILRTFLKGQNLKVMMQGLDLLNQNNGFTRSGYGTTLSQTRYTTIKRYFTLSVTWDFNKMGGGVSK